MSDKEIKCLLLAAALVWLVLTIIIKKEIR